MLTKVRFLYDVCKSYILQERVIMSRYYVGTILYCYKMVSLCREKNKVIRQYDGNITARGKQGVRANLYRFDSCVMYCFKFVILLHILECKKTS